MRRDKDELLNSYKEYENEEERIKYFDLFVVLSIFILALALFFPKVYIANQIYYKSREVNRLLDQYEILKEENRLLNQKLEYQKFKNKILNYAFEDDF